MGDISESRLNDVLKELGYGNAKISAFTSEEDGQEYAVWLVSTEGGKSVLKKAKAFEKEVYGSFFSLKEPYVPQLLASCSLDGDDYILMEYCEGEDLRIADRDRLEKAVDALSQMQDEFWQREDLYDRAYTMEKALSSVVERGRWLGSELLEKAYGRFIEVYKKTPRTLCHGDLLPINLLVGDRAVLIDWEYGGMLPYLSSFARLTSHGRDERDSFFYMSEEDRSFAVDRYYEMLPGRHGISYEDYRRSLDHFFFYEYCEWVMLGNRYEDSDRERYGYYLKLAQDMAGRILEE